MQFCLLGRPQLTVKPARSFGLQRVHADLNLVNVTAFGASQRPVLEAVPWQFDESLRAIDTRNSEDDSRAEEIKWIDEACDAPLGSGGSVTELSVTDESRRRRGD